ncbi:MAG TPA: class I SAM-dependent methyltransferase [Jatrophihabitans sp.]
MDDDGATPFRTTPASYDDHVGRYGAELARGLIGLAGVGARDKVLDVGCGTGLLTAELAAVLPAANVAALDPSEPFAAACRSRVPDADVRVGRGERIPFEQATFDALLAQLSVNFMSDPAGGVREMRRVARPGGVVAACVWDYAGEMTLLRAFWDAARRVDPASARFDEGVTMPFCNRTELSALWVGAGLRDVEIEALRPSVRYSDFDDLWRPFLAGVAPSGAYATSLDDAGRAALRSEFFLGLGAPAGSFVLTARAWGVVGRR